MTNVTEKGGADAQQVNTGSVAINGNEVKPKKRRRGLGEVSGATRMRFDERDIDRATGLFKGHLDSIEITYSTQKEDSQLISFAGMKVPSLVFTFASNDPNASKRKYVTLRISPAESTALSIPNGIEAWKVEQPLSWLKHIMDVFVLKGKPMTEEQEDSLCLPFEDFDDNMEYVQVPAEEVLAGWKSLFDNFLAIMENGGKPVYKTANGGIIPLWLKLLRFVKTKQGWKPTVNGTSAGDFAFPAFCGDGCVELYYNDRPPMIHVNAATESIIMREIAKKPTNIQAPGAAPFNPQVPAAAAPFNAAPASPIQQPIEAGAEDLPF